MNRVWIGILILFLGNAALAQDIQITATVDRNPVALDEQFTYQVEVSGATQSLPDVQLPDFPNFAILSGPNVSTSVQIINFKMKASKIYSVILMPREAGSFLISPASLHYKGKTYRSNSITVRVTRQKTYRSTKPRNRGPSATQSRQSTNLSDVLFLRAIPSKRTVFVNEQINIAYKIYFRVNIQNPELIKSPETVGFWVEEYPSGQNVPIHQEILNGVQYNVAEIKKLALFPTKVGKLTVTPMELAIEAVVRQRRRNPFDVFDDFFQSPFGQVVHKKLVSEAVQITVKPLPEEGKPAQFSGLVGDFRLVTNLDKTVVPANEAISFKIRLNGTGNLKALNALPVQFPPSFEVYDPKVKENVNRKGTYLTSSKEFEYVLIPRVPGKYRIQSFQIPFFNPFEKRYKTLTAPEYTIDVSRGKELAAGISGGYVAKEEVKLLGKDIHFIKEEGLDLMPIGYRPYRAPWFWMALLVPVLALAGAYGYRTHQEKMSTNIEYARKRKANKQAHHRLKEAYHHLRHQQFADFYAEVSRALIGYVADKTNRPEAGLMREEVEKLLRSYRVDAEWINEFLKCLDEADFRRFAPGEVTDEVARTFYKRAEEILVKLEKYF